jgi:hypothetical protein
MDLASSGCVNNSGVKPKLLHLMNMLKQPKEFIMDTLDVRIIESLTLDKSGLSYQPKIAADDAF